MREIEREHKQSAPIDDDHFVVIPDQIAGRPSYGDSLLEKTCLKLAQILFSATVHISHKRRNLNAICNRRLQSLFNFTAVEAKDCDLDAFLGSLQSRKNRGCPVLWLNDQFHL